MTFDTFAYIFLCNPLLIVVLYFFVSTYFCHELFSFDMMYMVF